MELGTPGYTGSEKKLRLHRKNAKKIPQSEAGRTHKKPACFEKFQSRQADRPLLREKICGDDFP